ncbi:N-acetylglucosamine-6-phosphate deacetylase [Desertihabitans aurantiacus]|uniref:N-acetylglucosamine-6-phosphate deacetylase n=1 Tax=Desertihabitans aurantiacus TaxID=2282477 RepID=UPI001E2D84E6|nr:N-acetylglucosamine-6-phosphate deacetylase [Desertihabitans aurantiacus]
MSNGGDLILRAEHVLLPDGWHDDVTVEVAGGRVLRISSGSGPAPDLTLDGRVVPGFVDTHVHGGGGASFSTTDPDEVRTVVETHARGGTTTTMASLVTAEIGVLVEQVRTLVPLVRSGELAGIHLEGPFLSEQRCGAHDPALLVDPSPERLEPLLDAAQGTLAMVTLAPERPHATEAVRRLREAGVRVAVGHTTADEQLAARTVEAGATVATHLFNAMSPVHHREPGPIPFLLTDPRVVVELIADGAHVHDDVLAMAVAAAGPDRVALVTDAMAAAGRPDGDFRLGALTVRVRDRVARLVDADGVEGSIAGSTLTMDGALRRVAGLRGQSLASASLMASTTPARVHHLDGVGRLSEGARADLVQLDDQLGVQAVLRAGRPLVRMA